jgi:GAF domain-containing protein
MKISPERLAEVFVEVADTLVDEFDVIEFLEVVAIRTANLLDDSAVGVLLANHGGNLEFIAASEESVRLLELFQVQQSEGPCLDAFRTGKPVVSADLRKATKRWPQFAPRSVAAGLLSVHAFPLRLRAETIGVLNVFSANVNGHLTGTDSAVVQALADVAAIGLLQERAIKRGELLTEQLQGALNSRVIIEQAKGVVAQACGVTVNQAFEIIRHYSRNHQRRLSEVAHAVVTDRQSVAGLFRLQVNDPLTSPSVDP